MLPAAMSAVMGSTTNTMNDTDNLAGSASSTVVDAVASHLMADNLDLKVAYAIEHALRCEALTLLHDERQQHQRLRHQHQQLIEEYRAHRQRVMAADLALRVESTSEAA